MIDLNYTIGNNGQVTLSATGSTIQTASITTSGFPVQVTVTGDAEPGGSGWHELQIFRDSTAIGEVLHIETPTGGLNMTVAMSVIDTPVAGTYTYSVKIVRSSGMSARYSESGQLYMIVEEKVISSYNAINWIRRDINPPVTYYGYSYDMNAADTDNTWSIKKVTVSGTVETVKWANGSYGNISKWSERAASFAIPSGSLGLTCSSINPMNNNVILNISWNQLSGVDAYQVIISEGGIIYSELGTQLYNNQNFNPSQITTTVVNGGSYNYNYAYTGHTYTITLNAVNVAGASSSTTKITV
jgi:hypothetical protein